MPRSTIEKIGSVTILNLKGNTYFDMGVDYGRLLKNELSASLDILLKSKKPNVTYDHFSALAGNFHDKYSYPFESFIEGIAQGSGLSLDDCKILNAMETLKPLIADDIGGPKATSQCAFWSLPPSKTSTKAVIVGRNYDYQRPFHDIAKMLTVTVLHKPDTLSTAIIGLPGQVYCPSCVNENGIFLELNSGKALKSAKWAFVNDHERKSILIKLLEMLQCSPTLDKLTNELKSIQSDTTLIINACNQTTTRSFEFSSTLGMKPFFPEANASFVTTNFFLNSSWANISSSLSIPVNDSQVHWDAVSRRNNLLDLVGLNKTYTLADALDIANQTVWKDFTIYQIVYDSSKLTVHLRNPDSSWSEIALNKYFSPSWDIKALDISSHLAQKAIPSFTMGFISGFTDPFLQKLSGGHSKHLNKVVLAATMYLTDASFASIFIYTALESLMQASGFSKSKSSTLAWSSVMLLSLLDENPSLVMAESLVAVLSNIIGNKSGQYLSSKLSLLFSHPASRITQDSQLPEPRVTIAQ